jgi:hypothetical protein
MRLRLKEDPKEWRKAALFGAAGFAVLSTVLLWRRVLPWNCWIGILTALFLAAIAACLRPRRFRGYYRFTARLGFAFAQLLGRIVLAALFFLFVTPMGSLLRLFGKDPLQLKPPRESQTCWHPARKSTPLDRLF